MSIVQQTLYHKEKRDSTAKWFAFAIIPVLNLYYLWKAAEVVSGHEQIISRQYEALEHSDKMESTGRWFGVFLLPVILGSVAGFFLMAGIMIAVVLKIAAIALYIYVLYKMAISVSGHETIHPRKYETVGHKGKKDSTAKWVAFGLIPILNLYFLWKMGETISGHETVYK